MTACSRDQRLDMVLCFGILLGCFYFHVYIGAAAITSINTSSPDLAESFFVKFGASGSGTDGDGRTWLGDVGSNFTLLSLNTISTDTAKNLSSVPSTPYSNARFFTSNFTYSFPVSLGRYFFRLHCNPTNYTNQTDYLERFSVTSSGNFTLLKNFSSSQTVQALEKLYLVREFSIAVANSSKVLALTFGPSSNLPNSYAFVNGIEIVHMPHIFDSANPRVVASSVVYPIGSDVALETAYRLNVGGNYLSPGHDSGLFREWYDDSPYIHGAGFGVTYSKDANVTINLDKVPSFIAPLDVYATARSMCLRHSKVDVYEVTLIVPVRSGSHDFVAIFFSDGIGDPIFKDYGRRYLAAVRDSNPNNDLPPGKKSLVLAIVGAAVVVGFLVLLFLLTFYLLRRHRNRSTSITNNKNKQIVRPSEICRHFTFAEMNAATNGFNEDRILGVGGFGTVYRGKITIGSKKYSDVAIKRNNPKSVQGILEFQTELNMLSKLRHRHLVSLIGYCHKNSEMILVYDYMANGTFREHLYKTKNPPLPWKKRLEICIGAARGLHYLHTGGEHTIIHRDVKTTNILLDENWVAKVSDFGLSKTDPKLNKNQTISTAIKGSFGYMDPEYIRRCQLSEKSDVYSFGVVLFEALCGRPPVDSNLPEEQVNLADWVRECRERGVLDQIVDLNLEGQIDPECLEKFVEIAVKCLGKRWIDRPNMTDVLWNLELALGLQENGGRNCNNLDREHDDDVGLVGNKLEADGMTASGMFSVFSEIRNKEGR